MFLPVPPSPAQNPTPIAETDKVPQELVGDLRLLVGDNAQQFLRSWLPALTGQAGSMGFNRAAFFLGGFYLAYRRMYQAAFIYYAVVFAQLFAEVVLFRGVLGLTRPPAIVNFLVGFTTAIVTGTLANRWYLRHARRIVEEIRSQNLPDAERRQVLAARGGTDVIGALGVVVTSVVAGAMLYAALLLPLQQ